MTLHQIFERQTVRHGDKLALHFQNEEYSYAKLNFLSNQLARLLQEHYNVSTGDRVLMFLPKCSYQTIILLALSKLGAIYIPLTPRDCPDERLARIIKSTEPKCIISSDYREAIADLKRLDLATIHQIVEHYPTENLNLDISEEAPLYIIYTSGTTSEPKGVPIRHLGLSYWFNVMSSLFSKNGSYEKKVLSFCLASFDASIWEYLMAWIDGSPLYMADDITRDNSRQLKTFITENQLTHATLTPSLLRDFVALGLPDCLQVVCSTGEACTRDIIAAFEKANKQLFNCYGATEETFGLSVQACSLTLFDQHYGAPIAYPIGNEIKTYIFNEEMREASDGELYVESPYLTLGYWQQDNETHKNFIDYQGRRLYKTGDHFYKDTTNNLLRYAGRANSEVLKIRGALVNFLEIEAYVLELAGTQDACVIVCEKNSIHFLVIYVQICDFARVLSSEIRDYLLKRLSPTSIPARFFITTEPVPLTSNGKKDRKALQSNYYASRASVTSITELLPIEEKLVKIFEEVLDINKTDILLGDTFFTLGGDSMSRLALISAVKREFGIDLSLQDIYKHDLTISALADLIHEYRWKQTIDAPVSIILHQGEGAQPVFMIHPITGEATATYYEFSKLLSEKNTRLLKIYGVNARGLYNPLDISANIDLIAADYMRAIKQKQHQGPYILLGWSFGGVLAWKITELFEQNSQNIRLILMDTLCPNVTQRATPSAYREVLQQLVNDLREPLELSRLPILPETSFITHEEQIKIIFQTIAQFNQNKSTQLQLIAALLLANQRYTPKNISTTPHLFVCKQTQSKARALHPEVDDMNFSPTLGWSSLVATVILTVLPSAATHVDFVANPTVILEIAKYLKNSMPSEKALMTNESNNACNNDLRIRELQKRLLDLMQLLSTISLDQQSGIFSEEPITHNTKNSMISSSGHYVLYPTSSKQNTPSSSYDYGH